MAQLGVRDKRIFQALLLFGAFYVITSPDSAGLQVRLFVDWVLEQASNVKTFVDAALADDPITTTTTVVTTPTTVTGP